jgi:adiponectin receptor
MSDRATRSSNRKTSKVETGDDAIKPSKTRARRRSASAKRNVSELIYEGMEEQLKLGEAAVRRGEAVIKDMRGRGEAAVKDMSRRGSVAMKDVQAALEAALPRLCDYTALPDPVMRNLYIDNDYRINYGAWESFKSFFYFHNETMNIWSHLLSFLGLLLAAFMVLDAYSTDLSNGDRYIFLGYVFGTGMCLLASVVYHGFGCIDRACHDALLNADLFGVTLNISASMLAIVYYGYTCDEALRWQYSCYAAAVVPVGLVISMYGSIDHYGWAIRVFGFMALGAFASVPVINLWFSTPPEGVQHFVDNMAGWVYLGLSYLVGVIIFIIKWPERIFPQFTAQTSFSSHTLWHMCVSTGVAIGLHQILHMANIQRDSMSCAVWDSYNVK